MAAAAGEFAIKEEKLTMNSIIISAIKQVYDKQRAREVIDMLGRYPIQIAPIVIKRLRQKGAQWKRRQVLYFIIIISLFPTWYYSMSCYQYGEKEMPRTIIVHLIMQL